MIYDIRQTTTYTYASKVTYAHHVLRLMPIDARGQRVTPLRSTSVRRRWTT